MATATEGQAMARKAHGGKREGAGRPKGERDDITVRMDKGVVAKCRYVADVRGISLAEYLSEAMRPVADRDFSRAAKKEDHGDKEGV